MFRTCDNVLEWSHEEYNPQSQEGGMVEQWLALLPYNRKVLGFETAGLSVCSLHAAVALDV